MCVVKGNAYGHGSIAMGQLFQELGANYLAVAIPEEGGELRRSGVTIPILVLSAIADKQIPVCVEYDLTISVPSVEKLMAVNSYAQEHDIKVRVHIKIDTGMGRIGVHYARSEKFLDAMRACTHSIFEGIFSHFARSDEEHDFNNEQIKRFDTVIELFADAGFTFSHIHLANSGGIIYHPNARYTMVRAGMMLYGLFKGRVVPDTLTLRPVMTWKTEVVYFKFVEKGTGIGYNHRYIAKQDTRIVTLPVGYADGYQRAMGEYGKVIINDQLYPIAGTICMDQMMIDIGRYGEAYCGDEVILVGKSAHQNISFYDIADWSDTSIYELMSQISTRVPRIYLN